MKNRLKSYFAICAAMILFGMSFVWSEGLLTDQKFPPQSLIFLRLIIAGILLVAFLFATKRFQPLQKKDLKWFLLLALFEPFIYFLGETNGLRITESPSLGAVIVCTVPLFGMLACFLFYKERPTITNILGVLVTLPGVVLVMFNSDFKLSAPLTGILLLFTAAISTAGYAVIIRKLSRYSALSIVAFQNFIGAAYFLPLVLAYEQKPLAAVVWNFDLIYPFLMLSVFCSAIGFVLFVVSVKKIGVNQSNMFTALIPIVATVAAFLLGREGITLQQIIGVAVVISGLILSQYRRKTKNSENEAIVSIPEG